MKFTRWTGLLGLVIALAARPAAAAKPELVGWGFGEKNATEIVEKASKIGCDALITGSHDPEFLAEAVALGEKYDIKVFSCVTPIRDVKEWWPVRFPDEPIPWQVLSEKERAAEMFIGAGRNKTLVPYQWGGEPKMAHEVLLRKIACLTHPRTIELLKLQIDSIVAVPGIEGVAFDGFGYQNLLGCRCERCLGLLKAHRTTMPGAPPNVVAQDFFRDQLVTCINELAAHARERSSDIKTTIHIWPAYAPDPLYGNRLNVDYCGQTAAWYTLWPEEKIAHYSRIITEKANAYHRRSQGVGMIGYYDKPGLFPVKTAARVDMELKTMIDNGCRRIQVCSVRDVVDNPAIAAVFRKHFKEKEEEPKTKRKSFNALGRWRRGGR